MNRPLTGLMRIALGEIRFDDRVEGGYNTIYALSHRGICGALIPTDTPGRWSSRLTYFGQCEREKLLLNDRETALLALAQLRSRRLLNHPVMRVNRAREQARFAAELTKGRPLTSSEQEMVSQAIERTIDVLEAGTRRVHLCPEGDAVLDIVEREGHEVLAPCPTHGYFRTFGQLHSYESRLAVLFEPAVD